MERYTINVANGKATVVELLDPYLPPDHPDQEGVFVANRGLGENAEALGHAMFHLSCTADLKRGVRLDITCTE